MAVGEQERHQLHSALERVLGEQEAATIMELTPPVGWADVARRSDVDHLGVLTNTQLDQFRAQMDGRFEQFKTEVNGHFAQFETTMTGRFEQLEERFERKLAENQSKLMIFVTTTTLTAIIAVAGIAFTAAGLT